MSAASGKGKAPGPWQIWSDKVGQRLANPAQASATQGRHAAVAIVLQTGPHPDVLFMVRALRAGDRWSGHVSFPGGHHEPEDDHLLHTAQRETMEEVGLDLAQTAIPLGHLPPMQAKSHGQPVPLSVTPFVFVQHLPMDLDLGPEASHAFRIPLRPLLRGDLNDEKRLESQSVTKRFPAWRHEDWLVWGMTYHIMSGFLDELRTIGELPNADS